TADSCSVRGITGLTSLKARQPDLRRGCAKNPNPTHGSGWIFQVQPTREHARPSRYYYYTFLSYYPFLSFPRRASKEENNNVMSRRPWCRLDLKYPPTAVGGYFRIFTQSLPWVGFRTFHPTSVVNEGRVVVSSVSRFRSRSFCFCGSLRALLLNELAHC